MIQSKGGRARAEALSQEERTEIATKAAAARWNIPIATHEKEPLRIGNIEIPCAVLKGGIRVISERAVTKALGGKRGGSHWRRAKENPDGAVLPVYLSANNIKPFIDNDLSVALTPIIYCPKSGGKAYGLRAELLPKICNVFLKARDAGALHIKQRPLAAQADILVRGLAEVGIIAMVDEATGYQEVRDRLALQKILEKYITDEWAKWSRTFEPEFYIQLFRLKGIPYPPMTGTRKPGFVGHWTNDIIYSRLAPGVLEELRRKNPRSEATGIRARKYHQHLTRDYGHPALKELLSNVTFLMKTCTTDAEFKRKLEIAAPKLGETLSLPLGDA